MKTLYYKFLTLIICLFCLTYAEPASTQQAGKGLIVSPERVVFQPNQRTQELILSNRGNEQAKYRVSIINRKMNEWGNLEEAVEPAEGEFFAEDFIRYAPRQITLGPRETQKVRIMSRLPNSSPDGEYRSHILIQEVPQAKAAQNAGSSADGDVGVNVTAIFGISLPIILRNGDVSYNVEIKNPKIETANGHTFVNAELHRTGNKSAFGTAKILTDGKEIGILRNVATYLSTPYRHISVKIDSKYADKLKGKELTIMFEGDKGGPTASLQYTP